MSDLNQALLDVRKIRRQVAQSTEFRGYGPLTLAGTAVLAGVTGAVQAHWLPQPAANPAGYVALWLGTGFASATLIAAQMLTRSRRLHSGMAEEMVRAAVTQFLPAALAGVALPLILLRITPSVFWMLPGLWQVIFSLGVFACCRCLPRPMFLAGIWFLVCGLVCVALGDERALAPAAMATPFVAGMAFVAAIHLANGRKKAADEDEEE